LPLLRALRPASSYQTQQLHRKRLLNFKMADDNPSAGASARYLSSGLEIILKPVKQHSGPSGIPTLRAAVRNTNSHPVTILTYNSVLDKAAGVSGIIHVIDRSTGDEVPFDMVHFRRVWPPPRTAFVEIAPNDAVEVEIPLSTHKLEASREYDAVARWAWRGLWKGGADVTMDAFSKGDNMEGSWSNSTLEIKMEGTLEVEKQ
jgi:hypothetical protein